MSIAERRGHELDRRRVRRDLTVRAVGRVLLWATPVLALSFLWVPILVLVVFSFNDAPSVSVWRGFSLRWYENIAGLGESGTGFQTQLLLRSVRNSLLVAGVSTLVATTIGTMFALAVARGRFPGRRTFEALFYLPVVIPDITMGVSLAVFFRIVFELWQQWTGVRLVSGFGTIIIAHVAFNIAYVAIVVRARLATMDPGLEEAAYDLGANEWQAFWRVTFPILFPGVLAGALLAFTLSLDDFVVTFFTAGVGTTTLPIFVYGMLKQRVPPEINAVSALMILASLVLVATSLVLQRRGARQRGACLAPRAPLRRVPPGWTRLGSAAEPHDLHVLLEGATGPGHVLLREAEVAVLHRLRDRLVGTRERGVALRGEPEATLAAVVGAALALDQSSPHEAADHVRDGRRGLVQASRDVGRVLHSDRDALKDRQVLHGEPQVLLEPEVEEPIRVAGRLQDHTEELEDVGCGCLVGSHDTTMLRLFGRDACESWAGA
jgi:spermidine/putrescine transport system permease protein